MERRGDLKRRWVGIAVVLSALQIQGASAQDDFYISSFSPTTTSLAGGSTCGSPGVDCGTAADFQKSSSTVLTTQSGRAMQDGSR
jgi:hypothetical protein